MYNDFKSPRDIDNNYEAQQLNDFYNQEEYNQDKKEKLKQIRDNYRQQRQIISQLNFKDKFTCR